MLRRTLFILFLFASLLLRAQVPEYINFQTVIHYSNGSVIPQQNVSIIVNIIAQSADGDIVYRESHMVESNQFGLINFKIGEGSVLYGHWAELLWSWKDYYLMLELDTSGTGNNYIDMGIAQLLSVPYALFAQSSSQAAIWQTNDLGIHIDGDLGIQTSEPSEALEMGEDAEITLSSSMPGLGDNSLIQIVMSADTANPNINWADSNDIFAASFSAQQYNTDPLTLENRFQLATSGENNNRRYRIDFQFDKNIADISFNQSNLIVEGDFFAGDETEAPTSIMWGHQWVNNLNEFGIGNKDWTTQGVYGNSNAELFSHQTNNFLLLNAFNVENRCQLVLRRGNSEWSCGNDSVFYFKRNDAKRLVITPEGNVKIGSSTPMYKLDVYGDVNIPDGASYLIGGGKNGGKYAEFFEAEQVMQVGQVAGVNPQSGKLRSYEPGDMLVGIVCEPTGFIANAQHAHDKNFVLVALEGLCNYSPNKTITQGQTIKTTDGQLIGIKINNQVLLK